MKIVTGNNRIVTICLVSIIENYNNHVYSLIWAQIPWNSRPNITNTFLNYCFWGLTAQVYTLVILAIINIFIKLSILPITTLKYVDRIWFFWCCHRIALPTLVSLCLSKFSCQCSTELNILNVVNNLELFISSFFWFVGRWTLNWANWLSLSLP